MALADKKHNRMYSVTGSDADKIDSTRLIKMHNKFTNNEYLEDEDSFETLAPLIYQMEQMSQELDELRRFTTTDVGRKVILNCGWYGSTAARVYLPFAYGGTFDSTTTSNYLEYGAFTAPCDGTVDYVIVRSEAACGNSSVVIHVAANNTEMPVFDPGSFEADIVNMAADDTAYKFTNFRSSSQAGNSPVSFSAGNIIVVSFDPTNTPYDCIATMVLNLDWTTSL